MNSFYVDIVSPYFKMHVTNIIAVLLLCGYVYGITDQEVKKNFIREIMVCTKDFPVEVTDLLELDQLKTPTKNNVKCCLACAYKKTGNINKEGLYDLQAAYKFGESISDGDPKRLENSKKLADICVKVNDIKVSDGEKGCERAALTFKCVAEHAPKLGFKI